MARRAAPLNQACWLGRESDADAVGNVDTNVGGELRFHHWRTCLW
jgi:hypothetical protein